MNVIPLRKKEAGAEPPVALHDRAMDNLSFIRDTMARSTSFTAVPGWGMFAMGLLALWGSYMATWDLIPDWWVFAWLMTALAGWTTGVATMIYKARRAETPVLAGPGMRFITSFSPPILAGIVLSEVFYRVGMTSLMPGMWLLLYGVAVVTGGAFSVRVVPAMGLCFMVLGTVAFLAPNASAPFLFENFRVVDGLMALGFGGLHIFFWTHHRVPLRRIDCYGQSKHSPQQEDGGRALARGRRWRERRESRNPRQAHPRTGAPGYYERLGRQSLLEFHGTQEAAGDNRRQP